MSVEMAGRDRLPACRPDSAPSERDGYATRRASLAGFMARAT